MLLLHKVFIISYLETDQPFQLPPFPIYHRQRNFSPFKIQFWGQGFWKYGSLNMPCFSCPPNCYPLLPKPSGTWLAQVRGPETGWDLGNPGASSDCHGTLEWRQGEPCPDPLPPGADGEPSSWAKQPLCLRPVLPRRRETTTALGTPTKWGVVVSHLQPWWAKIYNDSSDGAGERWNKQSYQTGHCYQAPAWPGLRTP